MKPGLKKKEIEALAQLLSKHKKYTFLIGLLSEPNNSVYKKLLQNNQIKDLWFAVLKNFSKPFINLAQALASQHTEVLKEYLEVKFENNGCSDVEVTRSIINNYFSSRCACKYNKIWDPHNDILIQKTISIIGNRLSKCGIAIQKRYAIAYDFGLNSGVIAELEKDSALSFFLKALELFLEKNSFEATLQNVFNTLETFELNNTKAQIQHDLDTL